MWGAAHCRSTSSVVSHKFGQKSSRLPDGRDSVQTADSTEPRASASGGELYVERPGQNTSPLWQKHSHLGRRNEQARMPIPLRPGFGSCMQLATAEQ